MDITWLGTAGFEIKTGTDRIFLDPYITRNPEASPDQPRTFNDFSHPCQIFISHGHFDHVMDVPDIASAATASIFCSQSIVCRLSRRTRSNCSVFQAVRHHGQTFNFDHCQAQALFSHHIRFDLKLLLQTLAKINFKLTDYAGLIRDYPAGQVLAWRFIIEDKSILFFGSAGPRDRDLDEMAARPTDILLLPLQGHSKICDIGFRIVKKLSPRIVIPHHFDNFFPPISQRMNIQPFVDRINQFYDGKIKVRVPEINRTISID